MNFKRGLYVDEAKYLLRSIEVIEGLYEHLLRFPSNDETRFFTLSDHENAVKSGDAEQAAFHLFFDAYNWLKFFWYTNLYKGTKICEGLIDAYNNQNYLVWIILTRSLVEYSAVFYYYHNKVKQLQLDGPHFKGSQLETFENLMLQYARGTRFNWDELLRGDMDSLAKTFDSVIDAPNAVNVLTAIKHLAKKDTRFRQMEVAYAMLSDFAHPNMASHSAVIGMPETPTHMHRSRLSRDPDSARGEFLLAATLPSAELALANILEVLIDASHLLGTWLALFDNNASVSIDLTA